ncbi:stage II sporulation protein SpoIID [Corallococcus sp. H22C18031201]|uniref:SpoIID/LytB domain-containing protein n=1 Tax=Citreicoccus inhibens TaxID=2849499 RepID=UPI000E723433|nr:SpoIID/LytB domain-containing protein [Citreicoccus inhibens]MBU8896623.1 SpoIID/LytB domain-containing protein [Citreicoccus inhibens]RJS18675.1 stage II sporulation protein SpoIID [Corallococcus sp. H22C18031201]
MLRPVALVLLLLSPLPALAVETMRIAMEDADGEVRVSGRGLAMGGDAEDAQFVPLSSGQALIRRRGGRLEVNGAPVMGDAVRFRAGANAIDAGVPGDEPLRAGGSQVRGDVVVRTFKDGLQLINVISLEDYLAAVLGSEMPVSFPLEALKAQAVAARTYALQKKLEAYSNAFHLGSSVLHQVYGGVNREDPKTRAAVEATRGEVLTFELAPIEAYFHASCGGRTESGLAALQRDLPYLRPVDCPCGKLPASKWTATMSDGELRSALRASPEGLKVTGRTDTHRVTRVTLGDGSVVDGVLLRRKLGYTRLKSLDFDVERTAHGYTFSGRGYGHGAGLCQWGAKALADQGRDYRAILTHYYPGAELQHLY